MYAECRYISTYFNVSIPPKVPGQRQSKPRTKSDQKNGTQVVPWWLLAIERRPFCKATEQTPREMQKHQERFADKIAGQETQHCEHASRPGNNLGLPIPDCIEGRYGNQRTVHDADQCPEEQENASVYPR